ncbi:MAG: response regulator, partial [Elusimicrobia bacterium]|nr:response regulator [Elusimicrobiota bacterium]
MPKVLVVDDDADVRMILSAILRPVAEVVEARDGEEALRLVVCEKPT